MSQHSLNATEKRDWLRLARTQNVGPITFRQLLRRYSTARQALEILPELAKRGGSKRVLSPPPVAKIEQEIAYMEKLGGRFIASCEPDYPPLLAEVEDAPPIISVLGNVSLLHKKAIGIVGARNASLNGRKMAEKLAQDLGAAGFTITSGLARGIDTSAHTYSLKTGTIAVLAGGVDKIYPEENTALYNQIIEHGTIISDQPLTAEPRAQLFPRRNGLISGLSLGVIVVEAALKSGSLITAHMALEQGREVFAVPGSPLDPRANGTNDLLRQGAILTERADDVLNHISSNNNRLCEVSGAYTEAPLMPANDDELPEARTIILENLGFSPVLVDELIRRCQLSPTLVHTVLLELELAGRLDRQAGQQVSLL